MPVTSPRFALALSFCALTLSGVASPVYAQAGDSASSRAYAATASMSGPSITVGVNPVTLSSASLQMGSGPTKDCASTACVTLANPNVATPTKATNGKASASLSPIGLTSLKSGLRGESAALQADLTPVMGSATAKAQSVDVVLDEQTTKAMSQEVRDNLAKDLTKLASMLEPLATAAGPGPLADLHQVIDQLAKDPASRPIMRVIQQESSATIEQKPGATVTNGAAQVLIAPTDGGQALIRIDIEASTLQANSLAGSSGAGTITPGKMHVILLPGLVASIPAAVGPSTALAGTPVDQILTQLPKAASGILGPNFNATDSALVLDEASGGLKMEVSTSTDRACWFDSSVLETCVESGVGQRNVSENGSGIGMIAQPARIGLLRQNLLVGLHESRIGVNADPVPTSTKPSNPQDRTKPLPKTGTNLPPVWVLLLLALGSLGVLTVVRPRS